MLMGFVSCTWKVARVRYLILSCTPSTDGFRLILFASGDPCLSAPPLPPPLRPWTDSFKFKCEAVIAGLGTAYKRDTNGEAEDHGERVSKTHTTQQPPPSPPQRFVCMMTKRELNMGTEHTPHTGTHHVLWLSSKPDARPGSARGHCPSDQRHPLVARSRPCACLETMVMKRLKLKWM